MDGKRKVAVRLTAQQREQFESITRTGSGAARRILHARILLMADADHPLGRYTDQQIAKAQGVHVNTVARVRQAFVLRGQGAIDRKRRVSPPVPPKMDGAAEARLIALCCSQPPAGRRRWTMTLLADEMVKRKLIVSIGREAVRRTLKKTACGRGRSSGSAFPNATGRGLFRRWKSCSTPMRSPGKTTSR
jgi:hypothetical protein